MIGGEDVALFEPLFGFALGRITRHAGRKEAFGADFGPGGEGSESTQDEQASPQCQPGPPHRRNGSHVLGPAQQQTQYAELGDGDSNSDNSFG